MSDGTKSESRGRGGKGAAKRGQKSKSGRAKTKARGKREGKSKSKRPSYRGTTQKARERGAGFIDPKVSIVAKDPLRAQILAVAIQRLFSPSEFAREAGVALNVASYHFKVLKDHGILELVKTVKVGGALKHMYRATESAFISDADWGQLAEALRPGMAGTTLQDFNGRVTQAMMTGHFFDREDACLYWAPRDLDEIAWLEQVKLIRWCIEESDRLEVETVERRANGEDDGGNSYHTTFAIASFLSPTHEEVKQHKAKGKGKRDAARGKRKAKGKRGKK